MDSINKTTTLGLAVLPSGEPAAVEGIGLDDTAIVSIGRKTILRISTARIHEARVTWKVVKMIFDAAARDAALEYPASICACDADGLWREVAEDRESCRALFAALADGGTIALVGGAVRPEDVPKSKSRAARAMAKPKKVAPSGDTRKGAVVVRGLKSWQCNDGSGVIKASTGATSKRWGPTLICKGHRLECLVCHADRTMKREKRQTPQTECWILKHQHGATELLE